MALALVSQHLQHISLLELLELPSLRKFKTSFPALLLGDATIFFFGLTWLHFSLELSWSATFAAGLTPFIFGELLKIAITATSLPLIWRKISRTLNK